MELEKLKHPFNPNDVEFRAGATSQDKSRALALPYITSRAVMDRLDEVIGPENWQDKYEAGPLGGVMCGISIKINDQWVTKWDGADNTNFEPVKGGLSDSFKRAAVKWGIGRYLYDLPTIWVKAEQRGKSIIIDEDEARQKIFNTSPNKSIADSPGKSIPAFDKLEDLLHQLYQDFGLNEKAAKAKLKERGLSGWPSNGGARQKSTEMYLAVEKAMKK